MPSGNSHRSLKDNRGENMVEIVSIDHVRGAVAWIVVRLNYSFLAAKRRLDYN